VAGAALDRASVLRPVARLRERLLVRGATDLDERAPDGLPVPPAPLRVLVGSPDAQQFLERGAVSAETVAGAVEIRGTVLDFGVGCGRTARNWQHHPIELHGCDVNPAGVDWCRDNLPFLEARTNDPAPPSPYPDAMFDVVYAISILTHLTVERGEAWIRDWLRILRPGGTLLVTTHGDSYRDRLGRRALAAYDAGEPCVKAARLEGMNQCVTYHPAAYMRDLLGGLGDFRHIPGNTASRFLQDVWVVTPALTGIRAGARRRTG
jgi:SAM-dependent methyltransferase